MKYAGQTCEKAVRVDRSRRSCMSCTPSPENSLSFKSHHTHGRQAYAAGSARCSRSSRENRLQLAGSKSAHKRQTIRCRLRLTRESPWGLSLRVHVFGAAARNGKSINLQMPKTPHPISRRCQNGLGAWPGQAFRRYHEGTLQHACCDWRQRFSFGLELRFTSLDVKRARNIGNPA